MRTSDFLYDLPDEAIAQSPIEPRHDARLLDTRSMTDRRFIDLPELLDPGDVVIVNETRVRRARLIARKPSGGVVEVLLLRPTSDGAWEAMVRPARRVGPGTELRIGTAELRIVAGPDAGIVTLVSDADLAAVAEQFGEIPLPPYFTGHLEDAERYQTVFAHRLGSAAAPTAGLHFTPEVVAGLEARRIGLERVELHVGLDTFRPIVADRLDDHEMHSERFEIGDGAARRIEEARAAGGRVVAVGTTVVRTLETAGASGTVVAMSGSTDLFIRPGYRFSVVDLVVTNFHVPGSTLVVLIAAVLGDRWREVYEAALARRYRFLSFGDAMLAEVPR